MHQIVRTGLLAGLSLFPLSSLATNGMNMDAWGAKAGGMGGASYAYDSGNSAVMNNPATLGLRSHEKAEVGLGLTLLMPSVSSSHPMAGKENSDGDLYAMPTLSWVKRSGDWTYGAAMLAQGGMGTEYGKSSSLFAGGMASNGTPAPMSGGDIRSEVGVGRLMFPLAYRANDALTIAAQVDFVWATMDLKMDLDGNTLNMLMAGTPGVGSASGSLIGALPGPPTVINYARFDFSDDKSYSGAAHGTGWAGKLGLHYKFSDTLAAGATWHSKTSISDLKTDNATMQVGTSGGTMTMKGKMKVLDFQWPETFGVGLAWQANNKLMLAGDIKRVRWSSSMKDFAMQFEADGGGVITTAMEQNWKDHTVYMLGGQYMVKPDIALRAGINYASNPVPNATLNPLFPAIITRHFSFGAGWRMDKDSTLAASVTYAPEVEETNPGTGISSSHSQTTLRVNYNFTY